MTRLMCGLHHHSMTLSTHDVNTESLRRVSAKQWVYANMLHPWYEVALPLPHRPKNLQHGRMQILSLSDAMYANETLAMHSRLWEAFKLPTVSR